MLAKQRPIRSRRYLDWVKSLPSVLTSRTPCEPHHLIGHGHSGMATKSSDLFAFPLTHEEHRALHDGGWKQWERAHKSQWQYVAETIEKAVKEGVLKVT